MYVCNCEGVSENRVREVIADGARDVEQVGRACRAGTCCRMCRRDIREMIFQQGGDRDELTVAPLVAAK